MAASATMRLFHELCPGDVRGQAAFQPLAIRSARMTQEQQSAASGALLGELQCKIIRQEEAQ
jgi:hypothetical protein